MSGNTSELTSSVENRPTDPGIANALSEFVAECQRRQKPVDSSFRRAIDATPGAAFDPNTGRMNVPLISSEAFDALGAHLKFLHFNGREIERNNALIRDAVYAPPGWSERHWRALAIAVEANPADAATESGRERITEAALAYTQRARVPGATAATPAKPLQGGGKGKKGRKRKYDPIQDDAIEERWNRASESGEVTKEQFCEDHQNWKLTVATLDQLLSRCRSKRNYVPKK